MGFERALADPEDIGALASQHRTHHLAAVAQSASDLADRHPRVRERTDGRVSLLTTQIALVLDTLGRGEERRTDVRRADDVANLAHGATHRVQEIATDVLHQVPAVGDLDRVG